MSYHRKPIKTKNLRIHKKYFFDVLESIQHYKDWMFTDSNISRVEILPPTLDNLNMMHDYHLVWTVKGFKNPTEFSIWNRIRVKHGFNSMMYASKTIGNELISKAIIAMLNKESLPSSAEIKQEAEKNKLICVKDPITERRIIEREKYKRLYEKYTYILHHMFIKIIKTHRIRKMSLCSMN